MDSHRVRKKISILVAELRLRLILNFFVVAFMFFILAQKLEARFEMRRIQREESFVLFTKKGVLLLNRRDNVITVRLVLAVWHHMYLLLCDRRAPVAFKHIIR